MPPPGFRPNKAYRCSYVARQISVKATYRLWVTRAEHDAMAAVLANCSNTLAPTNRQSSAPVRAAQPAPSPAPAPARQPAPAPAPAPAPQPVPAPSSVYYANCAAVRAAGKAPLLLGQPGYAAPRLDRDNDGVACEK